MPAPAHSLTSPPPPQAYGEFKSRKESADASKIDILYAKYGGEQHSANALPSGMLLGQSESYVEYAADGSVLKVWS